MLKKNLIAGLIVLFIMVLVGSAYSTYAREKGSTMEKGENIKVNGVSKSFQNTLPYLTGSLDGKSNYIFATEMSETFESIWPSSGWIVTDTSDFDGGEYVLGKRDCHPHTGTFGGWMVGGGDQGSLLDCADTYPNNAQTWAIYGPFDLSEASDASLTFYLWGEAEAEETCLYDYLYFGSSIDGANFSDGQAYCGNWMGGASGNGYYQETLDLTSRLGESQVWIGILFSSDGSNTMGGFTIDDLSLVINDSQATPTATATATSTATPTQTSTPTPTSTKSNSGQLFLPLAINNFPKNTPTPTATPTTNPNPVVPNDGLWTGTTRCKDCYPSNHPVSFDVSSSGVYYSNFSITVYTWIVGMNGLCYGTITFRPAGTHEIQDGRIIYGDPSKSGDFSYTGQFINSTTISGTYSFKDNFIPFPCPGSSGYGSGSGTWTASWSSNVLVNGGE